MHVSVWYFRTHRCRVKSPLCVELYIHSTPAFTLYVDCNSIEISASDPVAVGDTEYVSRLYITESYSLLLSARWNGVVPADHKLFETSNIEMCSPSTIGTQVNCLKSFC